MTDDTRRTAAERLRKLMGDCPDARGCAADVPCNACTHCECIQAISDLVDEVEYRKRESADAIELAATQGTEITRLRTALEELTATVRGECPSLLNEDSGGNARLSLEIDRLLTSEGR